MRGKARKRGDRIKVAFVYYSFTSFVKTDYEILSKHFDVNRVNYRRFQDAFRILIAVLKSDISFSWFADGWAFFAVLFSKLFRKKSIIVVGGYDVACEPEINYGLYTKNKLRQYMGRFALNNADILLPVSDNLKIDCYKYLTHYRNIFVLHTGYDCEKFKPAGEKEDLILTVAPGGSERDIIHLKGLNTFIESAKYFSEKIKFVIIGVSKVVKEHLNDISPKNVEIFGFLSQEDLLKFYQNAKVYCQLSLREGLPNALCEAMLCECVPVGSTALGIKLIIGDTGFYAPYGDVKKTVGAIREALKSDKGKEARERIKKKFPIERREKGLVRIVKELIN